MSELQHKYRWEKRRQKTKSDMLSQLDIFDFVMVTFIFGIGLITLRFLFMYVIITTPCFEILATYGQIEGFKSAFHLTYIITLLIGVFWGLVMMDRIIRIRKSWGAMLWNGMILSCIIFLAIFIRSLVSQDDVMPPDGTLVVEWQAPGSEPRWQDVSDGTPYAFGQPACVWLDENKVAAGPSGQEIPAYSQLDLMGLGRPQIGILKARQTYRPLTPNERSRFLKKKACQADITLYGQRRDVCETPYSYPVDDTIQPPEWLLEEFKYD